MSIEPPIGYFRNGIGDFLIALPSLRAIISVFGQIELICDNSTVAEICRSISGIKIFDAKRDEFPKRRLLASFNTWVGPELRDVYDAVGAHEILLPNPALRSWHDAMFRIAEHLGCKREIEDFAHLSEFVWGEGSGLEIRAATILAVHRDTKNPKMVSKDFIDAVFRDLQDSATVSVEFGVGFDGSVANIDARNLPMSASLRVLSLAKHFLGVDSCFRHAADLMRVPCTLVLPSSHSVRMFENRYTKCELRLQGQSRP